MVNNGYTDGADIIPNIVIVTFFIVIPRVILMLSYYFLQSCYVLSDSDDIHSTHSGRVPYFCSSDQTCIAKGVFLVNTYHPDITKKR